MNGMRSKHFYVSHFSQSTSSLDLWEARTKPCDRCHTVFPNEYYYLIHNIKDHIKICLSRNEVYDYLVKVPKTSSTMKNAEKYWKQIKNNCENKLTNAKEIEYDFDHLVKEEDKKDICDTIEIKKVNEKGIKNGKRYVKQIQNDYKKKGKNEFYEENLAIKKELCEEIEIEINLKLDDDHEGNVLKKPYVCVCKKTFVHARHYNNHIDRVHNMKDVKCKFCPKVFKNKDNYYAHKYNCHGVPATCQICNSVLSSKRYLVAHMRRVHYNDGKSHKCSICHKSYRSKRYLQIHKKNSKHGNHIQRKSKESYNDTECTIKEPIRQSTRMYKRKKYFDELEVPISHNIIHSDNIKIGIKNNESYTGTEDESIESFNMDTKCKLNELEHVDSDTEYTTRVCNRKKHKNDLELSNSVINNLEKSKIPESTICLNDSEYRVGTIKKIENEELESFIKTEIKDEIEIEEIQYL